MLRLVTGMWPRFQRGLSIGLLVLLFLAVTGAVVIVITPIQFTESYTEFYVLGPDGAAEGYPTNLTTGQSARIIVGITNHEHGPTGYHFVGAWNDSAFTEVTFHLEPGENREFNLSVTAPTEPGRYDLNLRLYRSEAPNATPYRRLVLRVSVRAD